MPTNLPLWIEDAGGATAWRKWLTARVRSCCGRARDWAQKQSNPPHQLPSSIEWREAIVSALLLSEGRAYYSQFFLSVASPRKVTDWNWPSVDHCGTPASTDVVIETRLVNDMKTIMSKTEFLELIGHLAAVHGVAVREHDSWTCRRSFAREQGVDEPPLPD